MKIDASKDFETISSRIDAVKLAADFTGDDEVLKDMVVVFCQLLTNMYKTIPTTKGDAYVVLTKDLYDKVLQQHGLKRVVED